MEKVVCFIFTYFVVSREDFLEYAVIIRHPGWARSEKRGQDGDSGQKYNRKVEKSSEDAKWPDLVKSNSLVE
jgi:hypothetical protein